jgi:DNA sulfur modification protein DndE
MAYSFDKNEAQNEKAPIFRNFDIRNLTCEGAPTAILMRALEDAPIENVHFENITISSTQGVVCENVKGLVFDTVSVTPQQGPIYRITNGSDITIHQNTITKPTDVFLEVVGAASSNICIRESDLSTVSEIVCVKDGATKEAARIE